MAFTRPTLAELVDRIQQDFLSRLGLVEPVLRRAMVYVVSRVVAGAAHMLHGHLEYLSKQVFADKSDREFLIRQGALFGVSIKPAEYASGLIALSGTSGKVVPAGTVLVRADGTEYATDLEATLTEGSALVNVTALLPGASGNCPQGTELSFQSPVSGVNSTAIVQIDGLTNGSDEEDIEVFRARLLERMRNPPHGGNAADYVAWAKEVPGVTRAWCYPLENGDGTVVVRFVRDNDASPIPDVNEVAAVQSHIDELAPVTAAVTVKAPVAKALNYTIHLVPDTTETRAAVQAELADLLRREAEPGTRVLLSHIRNAIGDAEGVVDYNLVSPTTDVVHAVDEMAVPGVFTWV